MEDAYQFLPSISFPSFCLLWESDGRGGKTTSSLPWFHQYTSCFQGEWWWECLLVWKVKDWWEGGYGENSPAANMVVPRSAMTHHHQSQTCHLLPHCFLLWSPEDGIADRFWDIDFLILPLLHHSMALFADFWVLGGSSLRGTTDFQEGLELATYPYALRAVPVDGDCRMLLCTILFVYHIDWQLP